MKRWLKTFLIVIAIFLLPTLWLLISHIAAKHALERYKAQLRAAGEKLTIDELLLPRIPSDQNGAKLLKEAFTNLTDDSAILWNPPSAMGMVTPGKAMIGWQQPEIVSFTVYAERPHWRTDQWIGIPATRRRMTNTWEDIVQELKRYTSALDLIHKASASSRIDFEPDYHVSFPDRLKVSPTGKIGQTTLLLSTAILCDLHQGDTASSITNLDTALALINAWQDGRDWLIQSTRAAMAQKAAALQWEVLQATNLTDPELAFLQRDWESMEFVRPMEHVLEMERDRLELEIQDSRASNRPVLLASSGTPKTSKSSIGLDFILEAARRRLSDTLWRMNWSYYDELHTLQWEQVLIHCVRRIETDGYFQDAIAERDHTRFYGNDTGLKWLRNHLENQDERWAALYFGDAIPLNRTLAVEAARRITIAAIALKRYRIRHGIWPSDLKNLVPEFLAAIPRDPVDGLPLRYHPNTNGTFMLYSIGLDKTDEGGDPTPANSNWDFNPPPGFDLQDFDWPDGRDWVWPQPATPEEIQQFYTKLQQPASVYK